MVFLYIFLVRAAVNILFVTSQTKFFVIAGVEMLPYVYTLMNLIYISIQFVSLRSLASEALAYLKMITLALLLLLSAKDLAGYDSTIALTVISLLAVMIFDLFLNQFFTHYLNDLYPLKKSKKILPLIIGFSSLSFIVSGFLIKISLSVITLKSLSTAGCITLACSLLTLYLLPGADRSRSTEKDSGNAGEDISSSSLEKRKVLSSLLVRSFLLITFLNMLGKYWMDFQYSRAITLQFPGESELAGFIAIYCSLTDCMVIMAQFFISTKMFSTLRVTAILLLLPAVVFVLSVFTAFVPVPWVVIFSQFAYTLLAKSFNQPAMTIMTGVFLPKPRMAVLSLAGITASLGATFAGLSLIVLKSHFTFTGFFVMIAGVFGTMYYISSKTGKAYSEELETLLSQQKNAHEDPLTSLNDPFGMTDFPVQNLSDPDEMVRLAALQHLNFLKDSDTRKASLVKSALVDPSIKVRSAAASLMIISDSPEFRNTVIGILDDPEEADRVKANLIDRLANQKTRLELFQEMEKFLESDSPRLRAAACHYILKKSMARETIRKALMKLDEMIKSGASNAGRLAAVYTLGTLSHPVMLPALVDALHSRNTMVSRIAAKGLFHFPAPQVVRILEDFAQGKNGPAAEEARLNSSRIRSLLKENLIDRLSLTIRHNRSDVFSNLRKMDVQQIAFLEEMLRIENYGSMTELVSWVALSSPEDRDHFWEYFSVVQGRLVFSGREIDPAIVSENLVRPALLCGATGAVEEFTEKSCILFLTMLFIMRSRNFADTMNQSGEAEEKMEDFEKMVIRLVAATSPSPEKVLEAFAGVKSADEFLVSTGDEYLQSCLKQELYTLLKPMISGSMERKDIECSLHGIGFMADKEEEFLERIYHFLGFEIRKKGT